VTKVTGPVATFAANTNVGQEVSAAAQCQSGGVLIAGGYELANGSSAKAEITRTLPGNAGVNGNWQVTASVTTKGNQTISVQAYALCA